MPSDVNRFGRVVVCLFCVDLLLSLTFTINWWAGEPFFLITQFISFYGEQTIPAWYSSVKLFVLGGALLTVWRWNGPAPRLSLAALLLFAFLVLLMSMDEAVSLHERVGMFFTKMIASQAERGMHAVRTGYWPYIIGLPAAVVAAAALCGAYRAVADAPQGRARLTLGLAVLMFGAVALEALWNFLPDGPLADFFEPWAEETLEMLGVTVMLWGALSILALRGVTLAPRPDPNRR